MNEIPAREESCEAAQIAGLREEIEFLSQQVKRLIKAEGSLYDLQERLDAQLREYAGLYELNRTLNAIFDLSEVIACAVGYAINNLGYERVLFLYGGSAGGIIPSEALMDTTIRRSGTLSWNMPFPGKIPYLSVYSAALPICFVPRNVRTKHS